jgi:predicted ATP-dependent Lon-type protease
MARVHTPFPLRSNLIERLATKAKMFVNNANGQRGLVCQYDVVCFDEVSRISFDQKDA